jgi:protein phosphatase
MLPEHGVFVVADGMGGHQRGDLAANLCVDSIREWFTGTGRDEQRSFLGEMLRPLTDRRPREERDLVASIEYANRLIFDMASSNPALRGMGTTIVSMVVRKASMFVVYSGDSRIYRLRGRSFRQVSTDHSLLNEYIRLDMIRPADARNFPHRNVIMKALGLKAQADIEIFRRRTRPGDLYLLCSDGLNDMIEDAEIRFILERGGSLQERCDALILAALDAGGVDNVTVMLVEITGD